MPRGLSRKALELRRRDPLVAQRDLPVEREEVVDLQEARRAAILRLDLHRQARAKQALERARQQRADAHQAQRGQCLEQQRREGLRRHRERLARPRAHVVVQRRMELGQHRHGLQHGRPPVGPRRRREYLGQRRRRLQRRRVLGHGERQREAGTGIVFVDAQHRRVGAPRQVQPGQPRLDAAAHGAFTGAVEARAARGEEERQHLVAGRLLGRGGVRGVDVVVDKA